MAKKKTANRSTLYIRDMPRDLHDAFKAWCARRGITMTDKIKQLMADTVEKPERISA